MGFFDNIDWASGIIIPLVETIVVLSFISFITFIVVRAVLKTWQRKIKWFVKYSIKRTAYPIETMQWIIDNIEKGKNYYDIKKALLFSGTEQDIIDEILWLYTKTLREMQGGKKDNGRFKECNSTIKSPTTSLPTV